MTAVFTSIGSALQGAFPAPWNPHAIVLIGGDRYDTWIDKQLVKEVTVELTTDEASQVTFKVFDPRFELIDKYTTSDGIPWLVCKVYLGFGMDLGEPVFKGVLGRVARTDEDTVFTVYDMGYKMRQSREPEYHNNKHDLAVIEKLARRNGLAFVGPDRPLDLEPHHSLFQDSKNDWELSAARARESGLVLFVRHDTLFAKEPARIGGPKVTLIYRRDFQMVHGFDLQYKLPENELGRPKRVEYRGRGRGGRRLTGRSTHHPRGTLPVQVTEDLAMHTPRYAKRRAQAHKDLQRDPAFECTIRAIPPLPRVRPDARDTVALKEVGKLFSGRYLVDRVRHELQGSRFETEYTLYRDINA